MHRRTTPTDQRDWTDQPDQPDQPDRTRDDGTAGDPELDRPGRVDGPACWDLPDDTPTKHYPAAYRRAYDLDGRPRRRSPGFYDGGDIEGDIGVNGTGGDDGWDDDGWDDEDDWDDDAEWAKDWVTDLDAGWNDDAPGGPVWLPHPLTDELDNLTVAPTSTPRARATRTSTPAHWISDLATEQAHLLLIGWDDHELPPELAVQVRRLRKLIVQVSKRLGVQVEPPADPPTRPLVVPKAGPTAGPPARTGWTGRTGPARGTGVPR